MARDAANSDPAFRSRSRPLWRSRQIASHRCHNTLGRGESDPLTSRIETAAEDRHIISPPTFVAALHFHRKSFFSFHLRAFHFLRKDSASRAQKQTEFVFCRGEDYLSEAKPPPAEARHKGVRSTDFDPHFSRKIFFLLFLSSKEPKKTARRKWSGNLRRPAKTGVCRGFTAHSCRFDCGGSAKPASGLCPRLRPVVASKPAPFFHARRRSFLLPTFSQHHGIMQARGLPKINNSNRNHRCAQRTAASAMHRKRAGATFATKRWQNNILAKNSQAVDLNDRTAKSAENVAERRNPPPLQ